MTERFDGTVLAAIVISLLIRLRGRDFLNIIGDYLISGKKYTR